MLPREVLLTMPQAVWWYQYLKQCGDINISSSVVISISQALWWYQYLKPCGDINISSLVVISISQALWWYQYLKPCGDINISSFVVLCFRLGVREWWLHIWCWLHQPGGQGGRHWSQQVWGRYVHYVTRHMPYSTALYDKLYIGDILGHVLNVTKYCCLNCLSPS